MPWSETKLTSSYSILQVNVFNQGIRSSSALNNALTPSQLSTIYKSPLAVEQLSQRERHMVSTIYAEAFTSEMKTATYIAAACPAASLLTLQRNAPFKRPPGSGKPPGDKDVQQMEERESTLEKEEEA